MYSVYRRITDSDKRGIQAYLTQSRTSMTKHQGGGGDVNV
jgi:hypothetical protein